MKFKNIIYCLLFLVIVSGGYAAEISGIGVNPRAIDLMDEFYATANLDGETCGTMINFLLDNKSFSSKLLGCERDEISSGIWDLKNNPVECGIHVLTTELKKNDEILDSRSINLQIGNIPSVEVTPGMPIVGEDVRFKLIDNKTNGALSYTSVKIYNTQDREGTRYEYKTDSSGELKFRPKETGKYGIILDDPLYCGSRTFYAKKLMTIVGPVPQNPMEGDTITMVVPRGTGVRVLDSSGNVYLKGSTSLGGGLNLTIDRAGNYTIAIGEVSSEYWGRNIPLYVSGKPVFDVDITPPIGILGKPVTVTVMNNGNPVEGATLDILPPSNIAEQQRITSSYGKASYTPLSSGRYEITVQKKGYSRAVREFLASGQLSIVIEPEILREDKDFAVVVRDSDGLALSGAKVSINGNIGQTDNDGKAIFRLSSGEYEILAENQGYNPERKKINVLGISSIGLSPSRIELGQRTEISVFDSKLNKISAEITAIKPDGTKEIIGETYTPATAGNYEISALRKNYMPVNTTLKVNPHPLNLTFDVQGEKLLFTVTSRENPIGGIEILIETPSGANEKIITDNNGVASWKITEEGTVTINLNSGNANGDYESKIITQKILKNGYNPFWLLLILIPIGVVIILIGRKFGRKGNGIYEKPEGKSSLSKI